MRKLMNKFQFRLAEFFPNNNGTLDDKQGNPANHRNLSNHRNLLISVSLLILTLVVLGILSLNVLRTDGSSLEIEIKDFFRYKVEKEFSNVP